MTNSAALAAPARSPSHPLVARHAPIVTMVLALIAIWYVAAVWMNLSLVRGGFERAETPYTTMELLAGTMEAERPLLPAPHQVLAAFFDGVFGYPPLAPRSLVYHALVTLSATALGFALGATFGIVLALFIVHSRVLERSLLPWIVCSQMVPILALAPIFIVVLGALGLQGLLPKAIISAYLCFFPVTIGMVKGLTSPDPLQSELMQTWSATPRQMLYKLRWPAAVPYLFASLKVAATISLIGAIVAELPTGGEAGIGARLLAGSYYGQTIQIWAALLTSAVIASGLIGVVGATEKRVAARMGGAAMNPRKLRLGFLLAAGAIGLSLVLPVSAEVSSLQTMTPRWQIVAAAGILFLVAAWRLGLVGIGIGLLAALIAATASLALLDDASIAGSARIGFWMIVIAVWIASAVAVVALSAMRPLALADRRALSFAVPLLFGIVVFYLWEVGVRGFGVSPVLLPAPSAAAAKFVSSLPILGRDFVQTFIKGVLIGYAIGCGAGLTVAILAHRFVFLGRGLLPLGNFFSALPLVGVAPIMVMWFGFDWPSKAAVVALVTFFPMLVNALAGLRASGRIERDLMRSYAAPYGASLTKLHLPAALPFVFNALKINATLALIGAIVAEFFGTPTQGIGFRISTEAGRMAIDMVWAEIALAAFAGMAFYGLVALAERAATFWHPSFRT